MFISLTIAQHVTSSLAELLLTLCGLGPLSVGVQAACLPLVLLTRPKAGRMENALPLTCCCHFRHSEGGTDQMSLERS